MSHLTLKEQLEALAIVSPPTISLDPSPKKEEKQVKLARPTGSKTPRTVKLAKPKPAWLEQAQYGVELLRVYFPACFKEMNNVQPLKIGIKQDLLIALGSKDMVVSEKACMVNSLAYYVGSLAYLKSVITDAVRIDLEGQPAGIVTAEEARYSLDRLDAKRQKKHSPVSVEAAT